MSARGGAGPSPAADPVRGGAPAFDPEANWGLLAPSTAQVTPAGAGGAARPAALTAAVTLAYAGVALAVAELLVLLGVLRGDAGSEGLGEEDAVLQITAVTTVTLMALALLVPAAAVVVAAIFTRRGNDAARLALIGLLSVIALARVCVVVQAAMPGGVAGSALEGQARLGAISGLVLAGLAAATVVLLLTPAVRQHFRPGPKPPIA
jgi:hypothetical protein